MFLHFTPVSLRNITKFRYLRLEHLYKYNIIPFRTKYLRINLQSYHYFLKKRKFKKIRNILSNYKYLFYALNIFCSIQQMIHLSNS